jgi:hypothetical protein
VIEPTNDMKQLESELRQEEAKIIAEMTRLVATSKVRTEEALNELVMATPKVLMLDSSPSLGCRYSWPLHSVPHTRGMTI